MLTKLEITVLIDLLTAARLLAALSSEVYSVPVYNGEFKTMSEFITELDVAIDAMQQRIGH